MEMRTIYVSNISSYDKKFAIVFQELIFIRFSHFHNVDDIAKNSINSVKICVYIKIFLMQKTNNQILK